MTPDGRWIRIVGEAVVDDNDDARRAMLDANPILGRLYSVGDGKFEVFYIDKMEATVYSFTEEPMKL